MHSKKKIIKIDYFNYLILGSFLSYIFGFFLYEDSGGGGFNDFIYHAWPIIKSFKDDFLFTLTNFNIRNSTLADENQRAINSANSLVESLRSLKDIDFTTFRTEVTSECVATNCIVTGNTAGNAVSPITLDSTTLYPISYFRAAQVSNDEIKLNITTIWKIGSKTFSSPLSTTFTNWRAK